MNDAENSQLFDEIDRLVLRYSTLLTKGKSRSRQLVCRPVGQVRQG